MSIDPRALRRCLGHFATGVTVVSCEADNAPHGATVNAFSAVSLEPPLVLVSVDRKTKLCKYLDGSPFAVSVLREPQHEVALHFAGKPMDQPPEWERQGGGPPRLAGALATISCAPWCSYDGGDHVLYLGEVEHFSSTAEDDPLVFYLGAFRHLGPAYREVPWLVSADSPGLTWF